MADRITRLAPSPTGALHVGNARTFLVNYLLARQNGWRVLMRIEDLDGPRTRSGADQQALDDLAWLAFRGHHLTAGIGSFDAQLERWSRATGMRVDRRRIAYYRITVMYIWLVSCLAALDNGARDHNRFTYINLISLLNVLMPRAMAEYQGLTLPEADVSTLNPLDSELSEQIHALADLVRISWPADERPAELGLITVMAQQVERFSQLNQAIDDENGGATARLIGSTATEAGTAEAFDDWLNAGAFDDEPVLQLLYANGVRRLHADTLMKPLADQPFLPL